MNNPVVRMVLRGIFVRLRRPILMILAIPAIRALARRAAWRFPHATRKLKGALLGNGMGSTAAVATMAQSLSENQLSPRAKMIRERLAQGLGNIRT